MSPYHGSSFDNVVPLVKNGNQEEVLFDLTDRLRDREAEIRQLENQLMLRGNPIKLDAAYEELLAHLKQREDDFRSDSIKQEDRIRELERENRKLKDKSHDRIRELKDKPHDRIRELERENRKLKDKVHNSRKLMDDQEKTIKLVEKETDDELKAMRDECTEMGQKVTNVLHENKDKDDQIRNKDHQIRIFEEMVESLNIEIDESKCEGDEDKNLLHRLGERVESCRYETNELERLNEELQHRVETQCHLLKEKDNEIMQMAAVGDQREDDLTDDIDRMSHNLRGIIQSQREALNDKDEEIRLLYQMTLAHEGIIDEAEYVTHTQRTTIKAKQKEVEDLSVAIERVQNKGLFSVLDNMCVSSNGREA